VGQIQKPFEFEGALLWGDDAKTRYNLSGFGYRDEVRRSLVELVDGVVTEFVAVDLPPKLNRSRALASFGELKSQPLKHSDPFPRVVGSVTSPSLLSALARTKKTPDKNLTAQDSLTLASAHQYFL